MSSVIWLTLKTFDFRQQESSTASIAHIRWYWCLLRMGGKHISGMRSRCHLGRKLLPVLTWKCLRLSKPTDLHRGLQYLPLLTPVLPFALPHLPLSTKEKPMNLYPSATTAGNAADVAHVRAFLQEAVDHYP